MRFNIFKLSAVAFFVFVQVLFVSCTDSDDVGENYKTFEGQTIKEFLDDNTDYSKFVKALDAANALSLMSSYGKYTCFVPTNEAVDEYVASHGFSSFEELLDSASAIRDMVYYHIIDGESNNVGTYKTTSFSNSNIETKNMLGRYIYTSITSDGTSWKINNKATITSSDNIVVNGVIHVVDQVLEGNNEILGKYILESSDFRLYAEALEATGLIEKLSLYEDENYKRPTNQTPDGHSAPQRRYYGYTALLETDSVLALNGIHSLSDMRNKAKELYPSNVDEDTDERSSLYQFVAYHLLPYKLTASQLCVTKAFVPTMTWEKPEWQAEHYRDGKFSLDSYLFPMAENMIINVQKFVWRDQAEQTPVFNDQRNPYDPKYTNFISECPDAVTIIPEKSNQDCLNGEVHALTGLLYYKENVYHKRIRMDFTSFLPELFNNDFISGKTSYFIPRGYCDNMTWDDKDGITVGYYGEFGTHSYYWGNVMIVNGRCNFEIEIGPVPSGSYEIRVGYHPRVRSVSLYPYGLVQYYIDGEPCGIPLDQSIIGVQSTDIGWNQDYCYGKDGNEETPFTNSSWWSGRETEDDYYGYTADKAMHNLGYMKAPDSYASEELTSGSGTKILNPIHAGTARNDGYALRRVLKMVTWSKTEKHTLRISNLEDHAFDLDFIEFMPKDLIEDEDTH